ncbi:Leucine-rich repeat serine/threonine-protein kinase 1 [Papilio machaon]|uniref:Leucine-rich repeat serine/threonine-protein kinase 1 n=1 Tax=Papilio machaon TaxID=76193 RepID=A0A0N0PEE2_PAPMA|nr:Leucine-rich repeat serine/threonine-protein kinase 1 [Papilio machaon]
MDLSPDEDNFQGRLLHQAALWDNEQLLRELLASGAAVDARDASGRTALHAAALAERSACLAALIAAGADVNATSDAAAGGETALHVAAARGHAENVRALLSAGARPELTEAAGDTALALAERGCHRHAANELREARAVYSDGAEWSTELYGNEAVLSDERVGCAEPNGLRSAERIGANAIERDAQSVVNRDALDHSAPLRRRDARADCREPGRRGHDRACETGSAASAAALVSAGADGRAHPVTRYGPLYIACYHGHKDIATLLLTHFPEAVQQETVEKWLPLHAACIGGHAALVTLLLEYPYPDTLLNTYTDASGQWRYRFAFDVNARDASGQTALYVACTLGNAAVVEALLAFTLPKERVPREQPDVAEEASEEGTPVAAGAAPSPHRAGISLGIHAIVSKLTGNNKQVYYKSLRRRLKESSVSQFVFVFDSQQGAAEAEARVRPVRVEVPRGADSCVAAAVRGGHLRVLRLLLAAGASPDGTAQPPHQEESETRDRRRSRSASAAYGRASASPSPSPARPGYADNRDGEGVWTALSLAALRRSVPALEMLLAAGATDPGGRALPLCAQHGLAEPLAALLATKAYPDPDYKLNKSVMSESVLSSRDADSALSYSARCPTTPVMVNWRDLRCHLPTIKMSWLRTAALRVNPKLSASCGGALLALTRLELAGNELRELPREIFSLVSLRYLNAAQNKLERLPSSGDPLEEELDRSRRGKRPARAAADVYTAPVLQELYLQDNRLEELPAALFSLPALASLDVSNNKLRALPPQMWSAPRLRDLNAALNHLRDLPPACRPQGSCATSGSPAETPQSPQLSASPSTHSGQFTLAGVSASQSKSSSRSPSIEGVEGVEGVAEDDDEVALPVGNRAGNAVWSEARRAHAWRGTLAASPPPARGGAWGGAGPGPGLGGGSPLTALNLSHNQFTSVPQPLACLAPSLTRLNMAYNSLRSMSYVTSYPTSLRQLDLSHNEITCWPSLPQVESFGLSDGDPLACYCPNSSGSSSSSSSRWGGGVRPRPRSGGSVRSQLLSAACPARRHLRLEGLRTLILANNLLSRIQLTTDDDGLATAVHQHSNDEDDEWGSGCNVKERLLFPLLSMLDVSCNCLRAVPPAIHELTNLSVLNISGNKDITDLPPQMGLLTRLWSLNTAGCALGEPLRSLVRGARCRSVDVVGYLRSVLQEAKPYARMKLMLVGVQGIGKTSLLECLRQESAMQHRRKPTDHWAKRMGNKSSRRGNVSTVGVDIGSWVYEKHRSTRGPVTFRTWDFGGQQESIQARAPGSPVIMVATHYDQVANSGLPENESPSALQRLIRSAVMAAPDADKLGLPRLLDSIEVSCSTRHNIRLLADIIYSVAFSVKPPGSKEPLLQQRVPATYLALEECVTALAAELREPVLRHDEYKRLVSTHALTCIGDPQSAPLGSPRVLRRPGEGVPYREFHVTQYMQQRNLRMFRDAAELHQATMFLHENGVLLHYDDATLKELYFVRPQWLCDVLAHVVTVREVNPFANNGIMKVEDLAHVFKASPLLARSEEARALAVSLLNKFELALCWDARVLLVPPLLPAHEPLTPQLALRTRTWPGTPRHARCAALAPAPAPAPLPADSPTLIQERGAGPGPGPGAGAGQTQVWGRRGGAALRRLLLLSYVPCGFWARLCARVLADAALAGAAPDLYRPPPEMEVDDAVSRALELSWGWRLWRTGMKLVCGELTLVALRELPPRYDPLLGAKGDEEEHDELYHNMRFRVRQEGTWCELDVQSSACVELLLPAHVCVLRRQDGLPLGGYQSISLEPNPEVLAKVLALVSDHVDLLLEDWYPSLGTRFVHTSEGRCLITRVVPCPGCVRDAGSPLAPLAPPLPGHAPSLAGHAPSRHDDQQLAQMLVRLELGEAEPRRLRLSEESRTSDGDSGVGAESNASSRIGSVEGVASASGPVATCWTLEECILAACSGQRLHCAQHADVDLRDVAPDTLLLDVEEERRARWEHIQRGAVCGRGAFGTVLAARWRPPGRPPIAVALKALQPVPPTAPHHLSALQAYKELSIVARLRHPHVLPLLAACPAPLALLLALAPRGALDAALREYRGCGRRLPPRLVRALALQLARALEYLHANRVLYRDLKSENVLVWELPRPAEAEAAERAPGPVPVHVKLGDYGISRMAPPSGTKGFGGTEGFMAPEIMRYNGEEEYNEKVDCFSFGMLLYEVLTLRQPFEGHEAVKEAVLEGARPALTPRDLQYPCSMVETMRRCWSGSPELRPSAAALVAVAAAPEFLALADAALARAPTTGVAAAKVHLPTEEGGLGWEVWFGGAEPERAHTLLANSTTFLHHHSLRVPPDKEAAVLVTAMCRVGSTMWLGDSVGRVSVYS